jgi:hypothetical protein
MKSYTSHDIWDLIVRCGSRVSRIGGQMRINYRHSKTEKGETGIIITVKESQRYNLYDNQYDIKALSKVYKVNWYKTDNECEWLSQLKMAVLLNKIIHDEEFSDRELWNMTLDMFKDHGLDFRHDKELKKTLVNRVKANIRSREHLLKYKFKMQFDQKRIDDNVEHLLSILEGK